MKNEVKISDTSRGADVHINGGVKFSEIEALAQSCSDGSCDCSPEMMNKIDDIQVSGKDGDVKITLQGKEVNAKEIQSCMSGCDCGF